MAAKRGKYIARARQICMMEELRENNRITMERVKKRLKIGEKVVVKHLLRAPGTWERVVEREGFEGILVAEYPHFWSILVPGAEENYRISVNKNDILTGEFTIYRA